MCRCIPKTPWRGDGEPMRTPDLSVTQWRKSSRSTDTGGDCVEIALLTQEMSEAR